MKPGTGPAAIRWLISIEPDARPLRPGVMLAAITVLAAACGGGGGGGGGGGNPPAVATMSVSPTQIAVSASLTDAAPTADVTVLLSNPDPTKDYYLAYNATDNGVDSVSMVDSQEARATARIAFKAPGLVGPGEFTDTVSLAVCLDAQCAQHIAGSPKDVTVKYTVNLAAPTLNSVSPGSVTAGGRDFTLTLIGSGFWTGSIVQWNGNDRPTTFVSSTELTARISSADIVAPGTATVTVTNPATPALVSAAATVSIVPASKDAAAFQIDPGHGGFIQFASVTLPAASKWSVDVGGTASYALIADGKVFVTVQGPSDPCALLALDQATGAVVWGPVTIPYPANAAYDNGRVFTVSGTSDLRGQMQAFDTATGQLLWTTALTGQSFFTTAPTAADGLVFTAGAGTGNTLYAVDQATGAVVWTRDANSSNGALAVTADGVYTFDGCDVTDLRPATGTKVWEFTSGCFGGGAGVAVVAGGVLYAQTGAIGANNGTRFDAETGAVLGSLTADSPPAIDGQRGYFLSGSTLSGVNLGTNSVLWTFTGDGQVDSAPIAVNGYVFVGSYSGLLYGLDGATGAELWRVNVGAAIYSSGSWTGMPLRGLTAGDGLLVVPAGSTVTAFELSSSP